MANNSIGTDFFDGATPISHAFSNEVGDFTLVKCATADIPSAVAGYAIGCILMNTTTGGLYVNTGTAASVTFTLLEDAGGNFTLPITASGTATTGNEFAITSTVTSGTVFLGTVATATFTTGGEVYLANMNAAVAGNGLAVVTSGAYTGTGLATLTAGAMTTGVGLQVTSTTGLTSGSLIRATTSTAGALTNGIIQISATGAYTGTVGALNVTATATTAGTLASILSASLTSGVGLRITLAGLTTGAAIDTTGIAAAKQNINMNASAGSTAAPQTNAPVGFFKIGIGGVDQWVPYYDAT